MKKNILILILLSLISVNVFSQANVKVYLVYNKVLNNVDLDGLFSGDSDFCFEFEITDNTAGNNINAGSTKPLTNTAYTFNNGNNGPWTDNYNSLHFNHDYECPSRVPTSINVSWRGLENDDATNYTLLLNDANTGWQSVSIPVGGVAGSPYTGTFTASAGGQTYEISFRVELTALSVNFMPDLICSATQHAVGATVDYAWCGYNGFEPGEKWKTDEEISGSGWIMFRAPNSGTVNINTNYSQTDFGTEYYIYHAADGFNCGNGNAVNGTQIKTKFDYLSFVDYADDDIPVFDPEGKADQDFSNNIFALGKPLVPNEVYYIQVGTDASGQYGNIRLGISNLNQTGGQVQDVPCQAPLRSFGTTSISDGNGNAPSFSLDKSRCYDLESDPGDNAVSLAAYPIDETQNGADDVNGTAWFKFVAPCSGRISIETNLPNSGESFYLFKADRRFGPGIPSDYKCKDLVIPNNDYSTYYVNGGINATALRVFDCLEPGYEYYVSLDPYAVNISNSFDVWLFDPGTAAGQPGNDNLCQAMANPTFEIPVESINGPTVGAIPGSYAGACFEDLAGEPFSSNSPSTRANKTVWHYFYAPASGSVDIIVSASNPVNWNVYKSFDGTLNGCYGGLANNSSSPCPPSNISANNGRTFTLDGTQNTAQLQPLLSNVSNGQAYELCCLNPGDLYVIQVDGRDVTNNNSLYTIEINENEVFAGNTILQNGTGNFYNASSVSPALVCYGDFVSLSKINQNVPSCKGIGFILHNSPIPTPNTALPDSIELAAINIFASTYNSSDIFTNNGSIASLPYNTVIYASALADRMSTWGSICPSADVEDAVPLVFLNDISVTNITVDGLNCIPFQNNVFVTIDGGLPAFDNSTYSWTILYNGIQLYNGTQVYGSSIDFFAPVQGIYTLNVSDSNGCVKSLSIDASGVLCNDFCLLFDTISIQPEYPDFYDCNPLTFGADLSFIIEGGSPVFFTSDYYTVNQIVNGISSVYTTFDSINLALNNGDVWSFEIWDTYNCDTLKISDTFNFDLSDCGNLCTESEISTENQPFGYEYNCLSNNIFEVSVVATGGIPSLNPSTFYYITINGSSYPGQNVTHFPFENGIEHSFYINAGDAWDIAITDTLGCGPVILSDVTPFIFDFIALTDSVSCDGDSLYGELTGSQIGVDYRLYKDGLPTSIILPGTGSSLIFGPILNDGVYSVQSFNSHHCPQDMNGFIEFLFSRNLDASIALISDVSCFGSNDGAIDITINNGVPAYVYTWFDANGSVIATTEDLNNISSGYYNVNVYDAYGCADSIDSIHVDGPSAPLTGTISTIDLLCAGSNTGSATINPTGGTTPYTYLWQNNDTAQTIGGLNAGWVSVTITDANGCTAYVSDTVNGPSAALEITLQRLSNALCFGSASGSILIDVIGGTPDYDILWSNGDTTLLNDSLFAGVYTVSVTDANGCTATAYYTISEPQDIAIAIAPTQPGCQGEQTGLASVGVNGGTAPYNYVWNTTPQQFGIVATQLFGNNWYTVTVQDFNGCIKTDSVYIQDPDTMTVTVLPGNTSCINGNDGYAYIQVDGGSAPYSYELNGNYQTDSVYTGLTPNNYYIFVEDNKGCVASSQFTITPTTSLDVTLYGTSTSEINATDEMIVLSGEPIQLNAELQNTTDSTQVVAYYWLPAEVNTTACDYDTLCNNPTVSASSNLQIVVEVVEWINGVGCSAFDTLDINVRTDYPAFFPTAFSPNNDYKLECLNDYFEMNVAGATNLDVKVFNRWGELVFSNPNQTNGPSDPNILDCSNPRNAWDGTYNGQPAPMGAYVYQVVATYFDGHEETFSGTITILR